MDTNRFRHLLRPVINATLVVWLALGAALPVGIAQAAGGGAIWYVKPGYGGAGDGTSWDDAFHDLQLALSTAGSDDQIWVATGMYKPTSTSTRTYSFALKSGVAIYGGFAGNEVLLSQRNWNANVTILSGDIGTPGVTTDNSYHVVTGDSTVGSAVLNGFTITGGNANGTSADSYGGGMTNNVGSPTLANVIFTANLASSLGGGIFNTQSSPHLTNVIFTNNSAGNAGGGMYNDNGSNSALSNVTFSGNASGNSGGGMADHDSSPTLSKVTFMANTSFDVGGGMHNESGSNPTLTDVTFSGNSAYSGGGIYDNDSNPTLTRVSFSGNSAYYGGGMANVGTSSGSNPTLTNVTMSGNSAVEGGGIDNSWGSPTLKNVTFSGNIVTSSGAGIHNVTSSSHIYDSIFWDSGPSEIANASSMTIADSIVSGGCPGGSCSRVMGSNPILGALQNNGGYTKTIAPGAGSPAIDKGNNLTCASKDQRGVARPQGGKCDMGAYEVRAKSFPSAGASDGWVLESGANTSTGGSMDASAATLRVGDDASNKQYRSVLSFDTSAVPDAAAVVLARVKVKKAAIVGTNPFTTHGTLTLDLKKPFFGAVLGLELGDFQASPSVAPAGSIGSTLVSGLYSGLLNTAGLGSVNKTGTTQLRLRFTTDDNNDGNADYLSLYSGNAITASYRPLIVVYYNP